MVPEGWNTLSVGRIARVIRGASPRPKGDSRYYGGNIPRLMVADVTRDGKYVIPKIDFLTETGAQQSRMMPAGTLTIVCSGTVGIPSILAVDACIHDGFLALAEISDNYDIEYLYYVFSRLQRDFDSVATHGGVFTNLTTSILKEFTILLPPISEQKKIAAILSSVDDAIQATQAVIDQTHRVKQGLLQQLLTRGIGHTRFKQTEIGAIPEEWDVKPLETLSKSINNGFVGTAAKHYVNDGIPYLMAKNIRDNRIELGQLSYISNGFHKDNPRSFLETGDLLTVQSGHIGTSATVPLELSGANCHALIITKLNNEQINSDFIAYYFNSPSGRNRLSRIFVGTTIKHINTKDLRKFLVPLPSRAEQTKIANIFKEIDKNQDESKSFLIQLNQTKKGLMQDLLTGRVRVKPDEVNTT